MDIPNNVISSSLYAKLAEDAELFGLVRSLRDVVAALAETTGRSVPHFTDHTIRHMDALWTVAEQVLTSDETSALTPAEVFLLACGFYLHDIGMAYAVTEEGPQKLKESAPYKSFLAGLIQTHRTDPKYQAQAVAIAVRQLHANAAKELAVGEIPGSTGRYLFEALTTRELWGATAGDIASSRLLKFAATDSIERI